MSAKHRCTLLVKRKGVSEVCLKHRVLVTECVAHEFRQTLKQFFNFQQL